MRSVKRFAYTVLLAVLAGTDSICFLWLLTLCGSSHESLLRKQGSAPMGQYLALLGANRDFWTALVLFLLTSLALAAVLFLIRRDRRLRRAEVEQEKLFDGETEWEEQP